MLIALYKNHSDLPYCGSKTNPFDVFEPNRFKGLPFKGQSEFKELEGKKLAMTGYKKITLEKEMYIFSLLKGLHQLEEADHLMAHVSVLCDCEMQKYGWWVRSEKVWIQITTKSREFTDKGVPVVLCPSGIRSEISLVWGGDNGMYTPYDFFATDSVRENLKMNPTLWSTFFAEQLSLDPALKSARNNVAFAKKMLETGSAKFAKKMLETAFETAKGDLDMLKTFKDHHLNTKLPCIVS